MACDRAGNLQSEFEVYVPVHRSWSGVFMKCAVIVGTMCLAAILAKVSVHVFECVTTCACMFVTHYFIRSNL